MLDTMTALLFIANKDVDMMVRQTSGLESKAETFSRDKVKKHLKALIQNRSFQTWFHKEARKMEGSHLDKQVVLFLLKNEELEELTEPEMEELWLILVPFLDAIDEAKQALRKLDRKWNRFVVNAYNDGVYYDVLYGKM